MKKLLPVFILFVGCTSIKETYKKPTYSVACSKEKEGKYCIPVETDLDPISQWKVQKWEYDMLPEMPDLGD